MRGICEPQKRRPRTRAPPSKNGSRIRGTTMADRKSAPKGGSNPDLGRGPVSALNPAMAPPIAVVTQTVQPGVFMGSILRYIIPLDVNIRTLHPQPRECHHIRTHARH